MIHGRKSIALARASGVLVAVLVIVSGVIFAMLQSQQIKLAGNTIQTATANLLISGEFWRFSRYYQATIYRLYDWRRPGGL